jgi:hypothetical protein
MFARKWRSISKLQRIAVGGGNFPQAIVSKRHKFDKREAVRINTTFFLNISINNISLLTFEMNAFV